MVIPSPLTTFLINNDCAFFAFIMIPEQLSLHVTEHALSLSQIILSPELQSKLLFLSSQRKLFP